MTTNTEGISVGVKSSLEDLEAAPLQASDNNTDNSNAAKERQDETNNTKQNNGRGEKVFASSSTMSATGQQQTVSHVTSNSGEESSKLEVGRSEEVMKAVDFSSLAMRTAKSLPSTVGNNNVEEEIEDPKPVLAHCPAGTGKAAEQPNKSQVTKSSEEKAIMQDTASTTKKKTVTIVVVNATPCKKSLLVAPAAEDRASTATSTTCSKLNMEKNLPRAAAEEVALSNTCTSSKTNAFSTSSEAPTCIDNTTPTVENPTAMLEITPKQQQKSDPLKQAQTLTLNSLGQKKKLDEANRPQQQCSVGDFSSVSRYRSTTAAFDRKENSPKNPTADVISSSSTSRSNNQTTSTFADTENPSTEEAMNHHVEDDDEPSPVIKSADDQPENSKKATKLSAASSHGTATAVAPSSSSSSLPNNKNCEGIIACCLCRRKFNTLSKLRKHERRSEMHKKNLIRQSRGEDTPFSKWMVKIKSMMTSDGSDGGGGGGGGYVTRSSSNSSHKKKRVKMASCAVDGRKGTLASSHSNKRSAATTTTTKKATGFSLSSASAGGPIAVWQCGICHVETFDTYDAARRHESTCNSEIAVARAGSDGGILSTLTSSASSARNGANDDKSTASSSRRQSDRILAKEIYRRERMEKERERIRKQQQFFSSNLMSAASNNEETTFSMSLIITDEDRSRLSDFNSILVDNVELFIVNEAFNIQVAQFSIANQLGGYASVKLRPHGTVGVRCKHCSHLPLDQQAPAGFSFPGKVVKLGSHAHEIGNNHLLCCLFVPEVTRQALEESKERCKGQSVSHGKVGLRTFMQEMARIWNLCNYSLISAKTGSGFSGVKFRDTVVEIPDRASFFATLSEWDGAGDSKGSDRVGNSCATSSTVPVPSLEPAPSSSPSSKSRQTAMKVSVSQKHKSKRSLLGLSSHKVAEAESEPRKRPRLDDERSKSSEKQNDAEMETNEEEKISEEEKNSVEKWSTPLQSTGENANVGSTVAPTTSFRLFIPDIDEKNLSPLQCYVRRHCVEAFVADENELATMKKDFRKVTPGQVGIRCVFCKSVPPAKREKRGVIYPSGTSGLYDAYTKLTMVHFDLCRNVPKLIKKQINDLKVNGTEGSVCPRDYCMHSAKKFGLMDSSNGIVLCSSVRHSLKDLSSDVASEVSASPEMNGDTNADVLGGSNEVEKSNASFCDTKHSVEQRNKSNLGHAISEISFLVASKDDRQHLNELHCFARSLLEFFVVDEHYDPDQSSGYGPEAAIGRVGMRCKFCLSRGQGSGKPKFPTSLSDIYHTTRKFMYDHLDNCAVMPKAVRAQYTRTRKKKSKRLGQTSNYYMKSAQKMGLYNFPKPREGLGLDLTVFEKGDDPDNYCSDEGSSFFETSLATAPPFHDNDAHENDASAEALAMAPSSDEKPLLSSTVPQCTLSSAESLPSSDDGRTQLVSVRHSLSPTLNLLLPSSDDTGPSKPPPIPGSLAELVAPAEHSLLTDYKYAVLNQLQICYFTKDDRKVGSRGGIGIGYPGACCRHCSIRKFFARSGKIMAKSAFPSVYVHFMECPDIAEEIRRDIMLRKRRDESDKRKLPSGAFWTVHNNLWARMLGSAVANKLLDDSEAKVAGGGSYIQVDVDDSRCDTLH